MKSVKCRTQQELGSTVEKLVLWFHVELLCRVYVDSTGGIWREI